MAGNFFVMPFMADIHVKVTPRKIERDMRKLRKRKAEIIDYAQYVLDSLSGNTEGHFIPTEPVINEQGMLSYGYYFRIYYDNICICEYSEDTCLCPEPPSQIPYVAGTTYRLDGVQFHTDAWSLTPNALMELDNLVEIMNRFPDIRVKISGHTDDVNSSEYNMELSAKRARSCVDYLISKGINGTRLESQGYGEGKPLTSNNTPEGSTTNRRVEFVILR